LKDDIGYPIYIEGGFGPSSRGTSLIHVESLSKSWIKQFIQVLSGHFKSPRQIQDFCARAEVLKPGLALFKK